MRTDIYIYIYMHTSPHSLLTHNWQDAIGYSKCCIYICIYNILNIYSIMQSLRYSYANNPNYYFVCDYSLLFDNMCLVFETFANS